MSIFLRVVILSFAILAVGATSFGNEVQSASALSGVLTAQEKTNLWSDFKTARIAAEKAFKKQQQVEIKEFQATQAQQSKTERDKERKARRAFFAQDMNGPDRRKYVQDYLARKAKLDQEQKDAYLLKKKIWDEQESEFQKKLNNQEGLFKNQLDQNQRPPAEAWPHN